MSTNTTEYVLAFSCPQSAGLTYALVGALMNYRGYIIEHKQFDDRYTHRFFARIHFSLEEPDSETMGKLRQDLAHLAETTGADWSLKPYGAKTRTLIMVSKQDHCLNDLLYRARVGALPIEIAGVASNHPDNRAQVEWHGIPYYHIPISKETKAESEQKLMDLVDRLDVDLLVLARYMQVLSDDLARKLSGKVINIHHSFLPSFKGAKPYHQAFARGVKTIGATAHYVNEELDEGPIITQQLINVDHAYGPDDLVAAGRDSECKALADAVRLHCESRVFLNENKTVVLT